MSLINTIMAILSQPLGVATRYIGKEQLRELARPMGSSAYGRYLLDILEDPVL